MEDGAREVYAAPRLYVSEVAVEKGYSVSGSEGIPPMVEDPWEDL